TGVDKMKKQNTRDVKAHLLRGAFYLLLFVGLVVVVALSAAINMPNPASKFSTWQDNLAFVKVRESASSVAASATRKNQTLTFADRVAYQHAIEEVYWRHRIWPKENSSPKPSLDAVMSRAQHEKKVVDYLRKSQALEHYSQLPITSEQLQAEMDRMAKHTKQPEVLRELFEALENDPFIIAECLARPALVERMLTNWYGHDQAIHSELKEPLKSWLAKAENQICTPITAPTAFYTLPTIGAGGCIDDTWTATGGSPPDARDSHTAVWTGHESIVWRGCSDTGGLHSGRTYDPS